MMIPWRKRASFTFTCPTLAGRWHEGGWERREGLSDKHRVLHGWDAMGFGDRRGTSDLGFRKSAFAERFSHFPGRSILHVRSKISFSRTFQEFLWNSNSWLGKRGEAKEGLQVILRLLAWTTGCMVVKLAGRGEGQAGSSALDTLLFAV